MESEKPVVVVTGISGNLGSRLMPMLGSFSVIGVDVTPPQTDLPLKFERLDLGEESSTRALYEILRDSRPAAVVHLAFVIDPVRSGVLDTERMWQINVAGTARVMEAITEANRTAESVIRQFIFPAAFRYTGRNWQLRRRSNRRWRRTRWLTPFIRNSVMRWYSNVRRRCGDAAFIYCVRTFLREPRWRIICWARSAELRTARARGRRKCGAKENGCPACYRAARSIWRTKYNSYTWMICHG